MSHVPELYLLQEALSRARMPWPQQHNSEAPRSARRIAMAARHRYASQLGNR